MRLSGAPCAAIYSVLSMCKCVSGPPKAGRPRATRPVCRSPAACAGRLPRARAAKWEPGHARPARLWPGSWPRFSRGLSWPRTAGSWSCRSTVGPWTPSWGEREGGDGRLVYSHTHWWLCHITDQQCSHTHRSPSPNIDTLFLNVFLALVAGLTTRA